MAATTGHVTCDHLLTKTTVEAANPALQVPDFNGFGTPERIRTSDLWLRRTLERHRRRPPEAACRLFSRSCVNWSQPATAPSRRGLSVICQSTSAVMAQLEAVAGSRAQLERPLSGGLTFLLNTLRLPTGVPVSAWLSA